MVTSVVQISDLKQRLQELKKRLESLGSYL